MKILAIKKDFNIPRSGINSIEMIDLNGVKQAILIQAENVGAPVLLFLHAGPGLPNPGVSCRSRDYTIATTTKELVKHYVLVFWDQRGTGKSYHSNITPESMNFSQFLLDAEKLIDYLRDRFDREKILIAGHSWGSMIGLSLASRIPDKLLGYIGISQVINCNENDRLCREWALMKAKQKGNKKALEELIQLGDPPYIKDYKQWSILRKWLMKFNSMIYSDDQIKHPGMKRIVLDMLTSPDYSLIEVYNTLSKGLRFAYTQQMIEDFAKVNFFESTPKLEIPVYFFHGRKDVHVFGSAVQTYIANLDAKKGKHLFWLEKSSHLLHPDDARYTEKILVDLAKKLER